MLSRRPAPLGLALALLPALLAAAPRAPAEELRFVVQSAHTGPIAGLAFSPDGKLALSASSDKSLKLWCLESGRLLRSIEDSADALRGCAFSPDSSRIAAIGADGSVFLWDAASGELLRAWKALDKQIDLMLAFSGDGRYLASVHGKRAYLLDPSAEAPLARVDLGDQYPSSLAASRDRLAVGTARGGIVLVDFRKAAVAATLACAACREVTALAFSPDGATLAAACSPSSGDANDLVLWETKSGKQRKRFAASQEPIEALAFSPDGKRIHGASASEAEGFASWDRESGAKLSSRPWKRATAGPSAFAAAFHPAAGLVAATLGDGSIGLWETATGLFLRPLRGYSEGLAAAAASADGLRLLAADYLSSKVAIWDLPAGRKVGSLELGAQVLDLSYSASGLAAAGGKGGTLLVWDPRTGRELARIKAAGLASPLVALSPDGSLLWAASPGVGYRLFDTRTGALAWESKGANWIARLRFAPDGRRAASCTLVDGVQIWDMGSGKVSTELRAGAGGSSPSDADFSPDGRLLAAAYDDGYLRLWDLASARVLAQTRASDRAARRVAFRPDGLSLLCADDSGRIAEWPIDLAAPARRLDDDRGRLAFLSYRGPDQVISASSTEGLAKIRSLDGSAWTAFKNHPNGKDWLAFNKEGYWDASSRGGEALGVAIGARAFGIDQFAAASNRPDLVMRPFFSEPDREAYFRSRYELRLRRLGLAGPGVLGPAPGSPSAPALPLARVLSARISGAEAELELDFAAGSAELASYALFVNDVPLLGPSGKPLAGASARARERIALSAGENKIEVSCLDHGGLESPRALVAAQGPAASKAALYYLGIGVSKYRNRAGGASIDLGYAAKDARDLESFLKGNPGGLYGRIETRVFADEAATRGCLGAAQSFLAQAGIDDAVIVFVAGHGLYDAEERYYFLSHEADLADLAGSALPFEELEDILRATASRRKLLLMDSCASGLREGAQAPASLPGGSRGISARVVPAPALRGIAVAGAAEQPRRWLFERDRYLFNDLSRRSGAIVFSSCTGDQVSWESEAFENGLFTEYLLRALAGAADRDKSGAVDSEELRRYVSEGVLAETRGRYPSEQLPVVDRDNLSLRLLLPSGR
ncbi:MAG TPA: caspase family protein [Spirochaetia bacterium]|nr:caspase family protein [Spirochaetia bacterium]HRZ63927.1 caspase family protein [Spirochaetia bacterium]